MSLLHWTRALLAVAIVAATTAPGKAPAPAPASASEPSLTYLKPVGPTKCEWVRQPLPSGAPTTLFTFDAACRRTEVSWSPNGKEGLVHSSPRGESERVWRVDFAAKTGKPLELTGLPDKSSIARVGFDAQGRVVMLLHASLEPEEGQGGEQFITFEGQRYPVAADDKEGYGIALAYRLEGADWKRFETKATGSYTRLDANKSIHDPGPSQTEMPGQAASESAVRMLNAALSPKDKFGKWMALPTPGGTLYYRAMQEDADGTESPKGPVRWEQDGKLVELEGFTATADNTVIFQLRGDLLVINVLGGTPTAYAFDTRAKKNLASVKDVGVPVTLWPEPARP
ncbi:MAG TPA: hypothetical protein VEY88_04700 [Archangium sp.]|nr:hypothetical protein [Archangium sp.]